MSNMCHPFEPDCGPYCLSCLDNSQQHCLKCLPYAPDPNNPPTCNCLSNYYLDMGVKTCLECAPQCVSCSGNANNCL